MPGRKFSVSSSKYRYGFNGKENDNEVKGEGNQQDYGMRPYDLRLSRLISVDPLTPQYPYLTPYQFAENNPIENIDFLGLQGNPATGAPTITLPTLSNWTVGPNGNIVNSTELIHGPINSGALSPQTKFITQNEFESLVPPYGGATINPDGVSATVFNANGSWQVSLLRKESKRLTVKDIVKIGADQFKADEINKNLFDFKRTIWTEKATPLILKPMNAYERITTDVRNLKAQDILAIKDRIAKGVATDMDKLHSAALVREKLDYQINIKHTGQGGPNASVLPANHAELWDNKSAYDEATDTWWSAEGEGKNAVFHRFSGDKNGTYHWSGSTGKNVNSKGQAVPNTFNAKAAPEKLREEVGYKYKKGT